MVTPMIRYGYVDVNVVVDMDMLTPCLRGTGLLVATRRMRVQNLYVNRERSGYEKRVRNEYVEGLKTGDMQKGV